MQDLNLTKKKKSKKPIKLDDDDRVDENASVAADKVTDDMGNTIIFYSYMFILLR